MTEADWLASADPAAMLHQVMNWSFSPAYILGDYRPSARKLRLFACACCRQLWSLLDERSRKGVQLAERWADGEPVHSELYDLVSGSQGIVSVLHFADASNVAFAVIDSARRHSTAILPSGAALLREIVGNPFQPVVWKAEWGVLVQKIPEWIYRERAWDGLPYMADALEEAGCDNDYVLQHLRGKELCPGCASGKGPHDGDYECEDGWMDLRGPHVRGCWALDLILGKE